MNITQRRLSASLLGTCLGGLFLGACGGGGSSGSGSSNTDFALSAVSVQPNATVQINRQIEFTFTKPVDFSSVNLNTINITQIGGVPASGEFRVKMRKLDPFDPCSPDVAVTNVIIFQPACPTQPDYSDAGLTPGGVQYQLNVVGSGGSGLSVRSTSGDLLGQGQTFNFVTPTSLAPEVLFVDPVVGSGPRAIVANPNCTNNSRSSYLELGGDTTQQIDFIQRPVTDPNLGADVDAVNFLAPLNFYSDASSRVTIVLQIDQPVNPSATNVSTSNVRLEYLVNEAAPSSPSSWASVPHSVVIEQNCTSIGARLRVVPTGILPQGRIVRVALSNTFADIVGNAGVLDAVVGSFRVATAVDPGTMTPGSTGDAFVEEFNAGGTAAGSDEDTATTLDAPPADWGQGELKASFNFGGTGGPGGHFVYRVIQLASGTTILNTTFQLITDQNNQFTEAVINGQVDVQDLIIDPNATLEIRGPNPCVIRASGTVQIYGKIVLKGANNSGVNSYCSANIPAAGATGNAGGGRGGAGNYLTTQTTPQGETGYGPFNTPGGGGVGGETSYGTTDPIAIPGAGGGGGAFAIDVPRAIITSSTATPTSINQACPEQTIIGLDAENGADSSTTSHSAVGPGFAHGGSKGPRPFVDLNPSDPTLAALDDDVGSPFEQYFHLDDFWGTMRVGISPAPTRLITGELATPWAGAGGGGGGDVAGSTTFPVLPFGPNLCRNYKGSGGGGGAGSLTILCLGDITFGNNTTSHFGRIDATGGTGGGGENTSNYNRVGGGSGGGSGGHVILQSGGNIDFSNCVQLLTDPTQTFQGNFKNSCGIFARGGEGGEGDSGGQTGSGGANHLSQELSPQFDLLPPNSYPTTGTTPGACAVLASNQGFANTVADAQIPSSQPHQIRGVGGDGGPGLIQLHVSELNHIIVPTVTATKMRNILRPPPVGSSQLNIETPFGTGGAHTGAWNLLLPIFGRNSMSQSKWIALGATSVPPTGSTPKPTNFFFDGTDRATGYIESPSGTVMELPAILTGTLATQPALPYITADKRSVVFDASTITDDVYLRNPALMGQFALKIVGTTTSMFDIATASYDSTAGTVRVTVSAGGLPLMGLTGTASVLPRFFRVKTDGTLDSLPSTSLIKIEFQAAAASSTGLPDAAHTSDWVTDITLLNSGTNPTSSTVRFFRFRISFEIGVGQPQLNINTSTPALEFLKVPFKF